MNTCLHAVSRVRTFTDAGRKRLGAAIRSSLEYNKRRNERLNLHRGDDGWRPDSTRSLRAVAGLVEHVTIHNLIVGGTKTANLDVLGAIAPYVYRVKGYKVDSTGTILRVEQDHSSVYSSWVDLLDLGTLNNEMDFVEKCHFDLPPDSIETLKRAISIMSRMVEAAENQKISNLKNMEDSLAAVIRRWMEEENLTPLEMRELVSQAIAESGFKGITPDAIADIAAGIRLPSEREVMFIYPLPNSLEDSRIPEDQRGFKDQHGNLYSLADMLAMSGISPKKAIAVKATAAKPKATKQKMAR